MKIQAEVSLYPLRKTSLEESIGTFVECLRHRGCSVSVGPMSSHLSGECGNVLQALAEAFEEVALDDDVVLTVKVSNACPCEADPDRDQKNQSSG